MLLGDNGFRRCGPTVGLSGLTGATDALLVVGVERHDQEALAELYRRHGGGLFNLALRVLSVRPLAEEVVQDIFTRLWHSPDRFDPARGSLRSFLLAQAHSRAIDIVRSETARQRRESRDADAVKAPYVLEDEAILADVGQQVRNVVGTLSQPEREAITLAYFGGHTYVEVASLLGVPEGTIKYRIRTGLARLRAALVAAGIDPLMANPAIA